MNCLLFSNSQFPNQGSEYLFYGLSSVINNFKKLLDQDITQFKILQTHDERLFLKSALKDQESKTNSYYQTKSLHAMLLQNSTYLQVPILIFFFRRQSLPERHDQKKIKVLNLPELEKQRWISHYFVLEITIIKTMEAYSLLIQQQISHFNI